MANPEQTNTENLNKFGMNPMKQPDGVTDDQNLSSDDTDTASGIKRADMMNRAETQVRENEDASLQDDSYTFDSDNTDSDEGIDDFDVEDVGGGMSDFDVDNNDDYV